MACSCLLLSCSMFLDSREIFWSCGESLTRFLEGERVWLLRATLVCVDRLRLGMGWGVTGRARIFFWTVGMGIFHTSEASSPSILFHTTRSEEKRQPEGGGFFSRSFTRFPIFCWEMGSSSLRLFKTRMCEVVS